MIDQWQEFRCTCIGGEVGQNKVNSVGLGDLIKTWTESIEQVRIKRDKQTDEEVAQGRSRK